MKAGTLLVLFAGAGVALYFATRDRVPTRAEIDASITKSLADIKAKQGGKS